ncbi:hypothetical protein [Mesorhizobium sp. KR1-2]|uniref:hypothetical protein n=1 Tax=Mesorhizobium sp. KR1-2 TaxID=3156609 RepID=UPI0032B37B64
MISTFAFARAAYRVSPDPERTPLLLAFVDSQARVVRQCCRHEFADEIDPADADIDPFGIVENAREFALQVVEFDGTAGVLDTAVKTSGCNLLGFTSKCAPKEELAYPLTANPAGDKKVNVIVNLNVRSEARETPASSARCLRAPAWKWTPA